MDEELKRLLATPFVHDTLMSVAGHPSFSSFGGAVTPGTEAGSYDPSRDQVRVRRGLGDAGTLQVIAHELGHRLTDSLMRDPHRDAAATALLSSMYPAYDSVQSVHPKTPQQRYAASDPQELAAMTFRAAVEALRKQGAARDSAVAAANRQLPGVEAWVRYLAPLLPQPSVTTAANQQR